MSIIATIIDLFVQPLHPFQWTRWIRALGRLEEGRECEFEELVERTREEAENIMQVEMPKKLVFLNDFSRVRSHLPFLTFLGDSR